MPGCVSGLPGAASACCTSRTTDIGSVIAPTQRIDEGSGSGSSVYVQIAQK